MAPGKMQDDSLDANETAPSECALELRERAAARGKTTTGRPLSLGEEPVELLGGDTTRGCVGGETTTCGAAPAARATYVTEPNGRGDIASYCDCVLAANWTKRSKLGHSWLRMNDVR